MTVCWVILRGQQMYTFIQAVHSLLYIVAKCNFFSVATWNDIIQYLHKCKGCTHFCEILYISIILSVYLSFYLWFYLSIIVSIILLYQFVSIYCFMSMRGFMSLSFCQSCLPFCLSFCLFIILSFYFISLSIILYLFFYVHVSFYVQLLYVHL